MKLSLWLLSVSFLMFGPMSAKAEDGMEQSVPNMRLSGSLEGGYWSGDRNLDNVSDLAVYRLGIRGDSQLSKLMNFHFEGRVWNQNAWGGDQNTLGELRELWLGLQPADSLEIKLGKQFMTWGRADGINPTDLINASDFTRLVPETSDQKLGSWIVKETIYFGSTSASVIWITNFDPSIIPLPSLGSGLSVVQQYPTNGAGQGAFKLESTGGAVDGSISYFDGYSHTPDMTFSGSTVTLYYPRIRVVGIDGAKNFGQFGLRGEASYTSQDNSISASPFSPRQNVVYLVLGVDRNFLEYLNLNFQYLGRYLSGFDDPNSLADPTIRAFALERVLLIQQQAQSQNGMTVRISYKWFHETLEAEVRGATWFQGGDSYVSPRITYALSDSTKVSGGADFYNGPSSSVFGFQQSNKLSFVELKYSF